VSNVPWITVDRVDRAAHPGTVAITIQANTDTHERSGTLKIAGNKVTVTQEKRRAADKRP
jgi:hypothetical protein